MSEVAFVVTHSPRAPAAAAVTERAAALGVTLTAHPGIDATAWFDVAAGGVLGIIHVPHAAPEAPGMPRGPLSPDPIEVASAGSHLIVTSFGLSDSPDERFATMLRLTAAVLGSTDSVAVALNDGVNLIRSDLFMELAALAVDGRSIPPQLALTLVVNELSGGRMSFVTNGLAHLGREEVMVICPVDGMGAVDLVYAVAAELLAGPACELPTGDTIGRTTDERIPI